MNNNNSLGVRTWRLLPIGLTLCAVNVSAQQPLDVDAMFSVGAGYSDNIGRQPVAAVDEVFARAGMLLDVIEDMPSRQLDIRSNLTYQWYEDAFDSEFVGGVDAFAEFTLIEERLRWVVEEDYGQVLSDPLLPSRPDNREDVNFFSTGPIVYFPLGVRTGLEVDLEYSSVRFEEQPSDNDRGQALVSLSREVRAGSFLSLNVLGERTEFDDEVMASNNFDRYEAFVRFEGERGQNEFSADIGYTELRLQNDDNSNGLLANFSIGRRLSPLATLTFAGGSRYSDQGNIFRFMQSLSRVPGQTNDLNTTVTPFRNDFANIIYIADGERTSIDFRVGWNGEEYEDRTDLDREVVFVDFYLQRDLTRRIFTNLDLRYTSREFSDLSRSDTDFLSALLFGYRLNSAMNVTVQGGRFDRDSNAANADFTENFVFIGVNYIPRIAR
ncbi:MAG: outer membrane beta-barrel protein [Woeseiaceae bacterium]